jgi:predicted nucleotidyltransferase component of viral defense system
MSEAHYLNKLYPLQDLVLHLFNEGAIQLYLTGGTALSRAFLNHRYSDDLDFFLNDNPDFENETDRATTLLQKQFEKVTIENKQSGFRKLFLENDNVKLKIDFVNDVAYHFNGFEKTTLYYKTDNPLNILSNKIAALNRRTSSGFAENIHSPGLI